MSELSPNSSWQEVESYLASVTMPFQYGKTFVHNNRNIALAIDIDPGGGFESGYELTSLSAPIPVQFTSLSSPLDTDSAFRFALHDVSVMDRVGKFFGMEDVELGFPEFDKQLIVKTNNPEKARQIFKDEVVRKVFQGLKDFSLEITHHENDNPEFTLEFLMDRAITDTSELKRIYQAYAMILDNLDNHD